MTYGENYFDQPDSQEVKVTYDDTKYQVVICPTGELVVIEILYIHTAYMDLMTWALGIDERLCNQ